MEYLIIVQASIIPSIQVDVILIKIQILKMRQSISSTSQDGNISYLFLRTTFRDEPFVTYIHDNKYEITEAEFSKSRFHNAKADILSENNLLHDPAMSVMRSIISFPSKRKIPEIKAYIKERLIDICFKNAQSSSNFSRYEACCTIDYIAEDYDFCSVLIKKKDGIDKLLNFIGRENHTQIRNKAILTLRKAIDKICSSENPDQQFFSKTFNGMILRLLLESVRIKVRQIVWLALRIYKQGGEETKKQQIVLAVSRSSCEIIKKGLLKPDQKQQLAHILQALVSVFSQGRYTEHLIWCIANYKIQALLMSYAEKDEDYSQTAMEILKQFQFWDQKFHEKKEYINNFFIFALSLTKNHPQKRRKITDICRIVRSMASHESLIQTLLSNIQLLKILNNLSLENDWQEEKNDQEFDFIMCQLYQNMIAKPKEKDEDENTIIGLILSSNVPKTLVEIISEDINKTTIRLLRAFNIISKMLNFEKKNNNKNRLVLRKFQQLGILQYLKKFEQNDLPYIRNVSQEIQEFYQTEEQSKSRKKQGNKFSKDNRKSSKGK